MLKKYKFILLASAMTVFLSLSMTGLAKADAAATAAAIDTCNKNLQNNLTRAAQDEIVAVDNFFSSVPDINVKLNYCMDQINALFDISAALSDPLGIIGKFIDQQIMSLIDQACSAAMGVITQVTSFVESQFNRFCVPLPMLGSIGTPNLGLKNVPCNGTSLLNPQFSTGSAASKPGVWMMWSK